MKNYKLVKENRDSFEIQHPDGSTFHVAKNGLAAHLSAKIANLPVQKFDDGGEVSTQDPDLLALQKQVPGITAVPAAAPVQPAPTVDADGGIQSPGPVGPSQAQQFGQDILKGVQTVGNWGQELQHFLSPNPGGEPTELNIPGLNGPGQMVAQNGPPQSVPATNSGTQASAIPKSQQISFAPPKQVNPMNGMMGDLNQNFAQQQKGISQEAQAQAAASAQQAKAWQDYQQKSQAAYQLYQQHLTNLDNENQQLTQAVANDKIDPNHYWSTQSTGAKIGALLGMLVSGAGTDGGRMTNMAYQNIQQNIARDIDAQKAELGKKENLLSMNMQKYHNLYLAQMATQNQLNSMVQGQVQQAAAQAGTQQAMGQANVLLGQLRNQQLQNQVEMARNMAVFQVSGGNAQGINPEFLPPDVRERVVNLPNGQIGLARSSADAQTVSKAIDAYSGLKNNINQLMDLTQNHSGSIMTPFTGNRARFETLYNGLVTTINQLQGLNRLNPDEYKSFKAMIPHSYDPSNVAQAKLSQLMQMIGSKESNEYSDHLEGYRPNLIQESKPIAQR